MRRNVNFKITLKEYIYKYYPCTCAGFIKDKGKIDPTCFTCSNYKRLLRMLVTIRESSILEGKELTIKAVKNITGEFVKTDREVFKSYEKDKFWFGENFTKFFH